MLTPQLVRQELGNARTWLPALLALAFAAPTGLAQTDLPPPTPLPSPEERPSDLPDPAGISPLAPRDTLTGDPIPWDAGPRRVAATALLAQGVQLASSADDTACAEESLCDAARRCRLLPGSLLWQPPLANQREPRMYGKITCLDKRSTYETALGAQIGLVRWGSPDACQEGLQLDVFGVAFSRFRMTDLHVLDYRVGLPLTYARGPWQAKLAVEHTSAHVGDEFLTQNPDFPSFSYFRDEIVLGLAHRFGDSLRVYGQVGFTFHSSDVLQGSNDRYDLGLEWSRQGATGPWGQPFAAVDVEFRAEQDYEANTTLQLGWQWRAPDHRHAGRLALEYYGGRSPYGQFFRNREDWIGLGMYYDW